MTSSTDSGFIPARPAPAAPPKPWTSTRITGTLLMLFWIAAAIGLVYYLYAAWDIDKVERYGPKFLSGLWTTLTLVGISIALGAAELVGGHHFPIFGRNQGAVKQRIGKAQQIIG